MPIRVEHILNVAIDDAPTSQAGTHVFQGVTPTRVSLYVQVVESGSGSTVTLTVELSPDAGATLISYDKLLTDAGTDGPVSSVVYSATGDDVVSLASEDVVNYIRVLMTGGSTTAVNYYDVDIWLVYSY